MSPIMSFCPVGNIYGSYIVDTSGCPRNKAKQEIYVHNVYILPTRLRNASCAEVMCVK